MKRSLCLAIMLMISAAGVHADRLVQPSGIFYYQPAASVFGGEALWNNPAGLSAYSADGLQIIGDYRNGDWFKSKGLLVHARRMGIAYRSLAQPSDSTLKEWIVGMGVPVGVDLNIGISYRWISSGPAAFDGQKQWEIGLLRRGHGPYSFGVTAGNLNRYKSAGQRTETELRYALGYRPVGNKLTLSADALLSTKTKFKNAQFVYHAEFTPLSGLYLNGFIDSHRNFELGGRVNLLESFVGSKSRFDRGGHNLGTTMFLGTTSVRQPSIIGQPAQRLIVPLSQFGAENPARPVFGKSSPAFVDLILTLYRAVQDKSVREVLFLSDGLHLSFAQSQEVREAITQLCANGKQVIFHDNAPSNLSCYLASAADKIIVPPVSEVYLVGLRAELSFYAGTMDKLGIKADLMRIGDYKSAVEPYTQTASSDAAKAQLNRLLDDLYDQFVDGIAEGRNLPKDSVKRLIDAGPFTSLAARNAGLIDELAYKADFVKDLGTKSRNISFAAYQKDTVATGSWESPATIAVVVADGEIIGKYDKGSPFDSDKPVTAGTMAAAFGQAQHNRQVKGVVFRIDSPGGDALASDVISQTVIHAAKRKPLVVSMGGVAASGGYYIAIPGQRLFADPATVTGSIGIFGGKVDMSGFYQKIGMGKELFTRGEHAGWLTTSRPFTDEERTKYMGHLAAFYDHFVSFAASNRRLPTDSVDNLGRGRVWTGREAVANGLVDQQGGLWQSLEYVRAKIGAKEVRVEVYPKRRPLFLFQAPRLLRSFASIFYRGGNDSGDDQAAADLIPDVTLQARLPYDLDIQ